MALIAISCGGPGGAPPTTGDDSTTGGMTTGAPGTSTSGSDSESSGATTITGTTTTTGATGSTSTSTTGQGSSSTTTDSGSTGEPCQPGTELCECFNCECLGDLVCNDDDICVEPTPSIWSECVDASQVDISCDDICVQESKTCDAAACDGVTYEFFAMENSCTNGTLPTSSVGVACGDVIPTEQWVRCCCS